MNKIPFHKKKWYVGNKVQKDLIIYVVCMGLLSQLVTMSQIYLDDIVTNGTHAFYIRYLINIIFIAYLIYGFWLTNRIAGPIHRMKRHMDEVASGESEALLQFRKQDYCSDLAESFNAVVKHEGRPCPICQGKSPEDN